MSEGYERENYICYSFCATLTASDAEAATCIVRYINNTTTISLQADPTYAEIVITCKRWDKVMKQQRAFVVG